MAERADIGGTPKRIFVRLPTWVGDVVMATPALRALRDRYPSAEICVEGGAHLQALVGGLRSVDRFWPDPGRGLGALRGRARALRDHGFDWAVLLPDALRAALAPAWARIPVRVGYARDAGRRLLLTHALAPPMQDGRRVPISMVERYLRIVRTLGCADPEPGLDLVVQNAARRAIDRRLPPVSGQADSRWLVVCPGAAFGSSKLWPPEHFARACDLLVERRGLRTVLAPGPSEEPIAREIRDRMASEATLLDAPPIGLGELAALIERARLVLSNDTGPRHMAVALGVPVITLMGPTDPRHTAHLLERQAVLREPVDCSPCHLKTCPIDHRCMVRLRPERVVEAAEELLG